MIFGLYAALIFPRAVVDFSAGADQELKQFEVPALHDKAQVQVAVNSGSALWRATIMDSSGNEVWRHDKLQGEQTTYTSEWLSLPSGQYNFTFGTLGIGGLQANVKITSKGGFW